MCPTTDLLHSSVVSVPKTVSESLSPAPPLTRSTSMDSAADVTDTAKPDELKKQTIGPWKQPFDPHPVVGQSTVMGIGLFMFLLAMIWPPLLLFFAYIFSKLIPYSFRTNDDATKRRQLFEEFAKDEDLPEAFRNTPSYIHKEESYWKNQRGMLLCTSIMTPTEQPLKAVVCYCHGYTDNASYVKQLENMRFVREGIAVVTIEYEGHGRSDGPMGLVSDWEKLVDDVADFFGEITAERFPNTPIFLMGESMGGAVAYSVYNRIPTVFCGVILCCPMCKIKEDMLPPQWVVDVLFWLIGPSGTTSFLGFLPIAPAKAELKYVSHKLAEKHDRISLSPLIFSRNPRLATARELIQVTKRISNSIQDFDAPFLVVHGKADLVTDPDLSQALYDESKSVDKSIKLYDDMWHALMCGEPDENIEMVFRDCIAWILARV